ncbi:SAV_2336 N-terminal domain-related protein [Streptomyces sp. NPDC002746]
MFDRLTGLLGRAGVDLSTEELLDVLWIAEVRRKGEARDVLPPDRRPQADPPVPGLEPEERVHEGRGHHAAGRDAPVPEPGPAEPQGLYAPAAPGGTGGRSSHAVGVSGVRTLESPRALNRAMRPLRRTVPSRTAVVLDEAATVERMAETTLPEPVLRARAERWLTAVLVIDDGPSMVLWQRYAAEVRTLLEGQGAFHDIRTHGLDSSGAPGPLLRPRPFAAGPRQAAGLRIDPVRPTAVLVLSDMVGPGWRTGAVPALLRRWARRAPVTILQPLPERMWPSHAGPVERLVVRSRQPAAPGSALRVSHPVLPEGLVSYAGTPVPVLELAEGQLAPWVSLLTDGHSRSPVPVLMIPDAGAEAASDAAEAGTTTPDTPPAAEERFRRFREAASPESRQLAGALASVTPLTLPVMRLVHEAYRTGQGTFHRAQLAEVFLGGLLRRSGLTARTGTPSDSTEYEFLPGVADLLLDTVRTSVAVGTAERVSEYLLRRGGTGPEFRARLSGDGPGAVAGLPDRAGPFAAASPELLRRLGLSDGSAPAPEAGAEHAEAAEPASSGPDVPEGPAEIYVMEHIAPEAVSLARRLLADPAVPPLVDRAAREIDERAGGWQSGYGWSAITNVTTLAQRLVATRLHAFRDELAQLIAAWLEELSAETDLVTRNTRGNLAIALSGLGETGKGAAHLRAVIDMSTRIHGPDHDYTLNARRYLHEMLYDADWYTEAEAEGRDLLETFARLAPAVDAQEHTRVMKYQAYALHRLKRFQEAETLLRTALAREEDAENAVSADLRLFTRGWYAAVLSAQGRYLEAERELRSGLDEQERSGEEKGGGTVRVLDGLADLIEECGRHEEAEPLRRAAVETSERVNGPDRLVTYQARRDLISTLRYLNRFTEARDEADALEPCLAENLGEFHRETLGLRERRALIHAELEEYDEAVALLERVLEQLVAVGSEERTKLSCRHNLGWVLHRAGRWAEAEELLRAVLTDKYAHLGSDSPSTGATRYVLAYVLEDLDRRDESRALFREQLAIEERTLPEDSVATSATRRKLARLLTEDGEHEEAAEQLRRVWSARTRGTGADAPLTLFAGHAYGVALMRVRRTEEAAEVLGAVAEGRVRVRGAGHSETLRTRQRLGEALAALGLTERARALWTEVRETAARELGEDHEIVRTATESLEPPEPLEPPAAPATHA